MGMPDLHREPSPLSAASPEPSRAEEAVARTIDALLAYHEERLDPAQHPLYGTLERERTERLCARLRDAKAVLW